jgi:hypothetical protein
MSQAQLNLNPPVTTPEKTNQGDPQAEGAENNGAQVNEPAGIPAEPDVEKLDREEAVAILKNIREQRKARRGRAKKASQLIRYLETIAYFARTGLFSYAELVNAVVRKGGPTVTRVEMWRFVKEHLPETISLRTKHKWNQKKTGGMGAANESA